MADSIHSFYKSTVLKLRELYPAEEARAMTDRLFKHYFGLSLAQRVLLGNCETRVETIALIEMALSKLMMHVPLQYVLGKVEFMDLEVDVNPSVLIPRPETEEMVSLILKPFLAGQPSQGLEILDIGTGSGCIAIALKRHLPESRVTAADISQAAIDVASLNASVNKVEVNFILTDILDRSQWPALPQFDLIVSNPPYVTHEEKLLMQPNVLEYEPHMALFVPDDDPLLFYRLIMELAKQKLRPEGSLWFEINEMFGKELKDLAFDQGFGEANIIFDFHGKSRFLQCFKSNH
jgi:release factor glutamine methyltransferase